MEQNGALPAAEFKLSNRLKIVEKQGVRHCDHKLTAYIVTDTRLNCNTFRKKFQNSSLFIMIRTHSGIIGFIRQNSALSSAFLAYAPDFLLFAEIQFCTLRDPPLPNCLHFASH